MIRGKAWTVSCETFFTRSLSKPGLREAVFTTYDIHRRHSRCPNGDNVKIVAERLGHSSAKMTLDTYAHAVPTLQRGSAERMDTLLNAIVDTSVDTREVQGA